MTTKGCPLCDRHSLLIYPVRYAIACPRGAGKAPALSGNFRIDSRAPQSAGEAQYTLRALRQGYLYAYDEKRERLSAYMVLGDGSLWQFPPDTTPPPGAKDALTQSCISRAETDFESLGRCVSVAHTPGSDEAAHLWIGWSNVRWTKDLVHNKIGDEAWRKQHMQCIDVPAMFAGEAADTGEFEAARGNVAHFAMDERAMKEAFGFSNRGPKDEIRQRRRDVAKRIGAAMAKSPNKKGFIVAVNDPVGITNDLAELTVPNEHNGFDTEMYWKYISAQLLGRAEAGIRAQARAVTGLTYGASKNIADINVANAAARTPAVPDPVGLFQFVRSWIKTGSADEAAKTEQRKIDDIPAAQQAAADEAWNAVVLKRGTDGKPMIGPDGKPLSLIDVKALARFREQEYPQALDAFRPKWQPLVQAHAAWLKSALLADWMAGNHDTEDLRSGYAYSESCAQAIGLAAGTDDCKSVLNEWLSGQASDRRNLYVRALMFNQTQLMKAADAQVHGSDIQYESIIGLYKAAFTNIEKLGNAANLRDRLVVSTANTMVDVLAQGLRNAAAGYVTIRLSLHAGAPIRAAQITPIEVRNWILDQGKALGLTLEEDRGERRAAAMKIGRQAIKAAPPTDAAVFGYAIDTDAWAKAGTLEASDIKAIKIPGVETTRKWLGSSSPVQFNQGVATAIFQLAALRFAYRDFVNGDRFSDDENLLKLTGSAISVLGNLVETVSETFAKAPSHPLSAFIMKQWAWFDRAMANTGARVGRWSGAAAGVMLAGYDVLKNSPQAYKSDAYELAALYALSGSLGIYLSFSPFLSAMPLIAGWLPPTWLVLVVSILAGISIAKLKPAAISGWILRCRFGNGERYHSLDEELMAFNSAVGE
jgi:hypothetical protein